MSYFGILLTRKGYRQFAGRYAAKQGLLARFHAIQIAETRTSFAAIQVIFSIPGRFKPRFQFSLRTGQTICIQKTTGNCNGHGTRSGIV